MKAATKPTVRYLEVLAWTVVALLAAGSLRVFRPEPLRDDSYQYLNVADNLDHGRGLTTSLIHFDMERSHGRIPAPLTTFPPGYPMVIAIANFGSSLEAAGRAISYVSYAGTAALLAWGLVLADVSAGWRQVTMFLFAANAVVLDFSTAVLTEPLYMFFATGAVVGLMWVEKQASAARGAIVGAVLANAAAGLAYWVRYAGVFLIAAVTIYALIQWIREKTRLRAIYSASAAVPIVMAGAVMLRNLETAGTWRGGNDVTVHNPALGVLATSIRAHLHLFLGEHAATFGLWEFMLLAGAVILVMLMMAEARGKRGSAAISAPGSGSLALLLGVCAGIYGAGLFYAGLRTVISLGTRMFVPMLPVYLLVFGLGGQWMLSRWPMIARSIWLKAALLLVTAGYAGVNARDLLEPPLPAGDKMLAALYSKPSADGQPLRQWVERNTGSGDVMLADDGQATGYVLHRPTISMIGAAYSPTRWECDEVKKQMKRFQSNYVILYRPSSFINEDLLVGQSQFVAASVFGQPPCGFVVAAENPGIRILALAEGASQK